MHLTAVSLTRPGHRPPIPAEMLVDLLWLHVTGSDPIEHIRVVAHDTGYDVVLYCLSGSPQQAGATARRVVRSALSTVPALAGWRLT